MERFVMFIVINSPPLQTEPQNRALVEQLKKICGAENQGDLGFDCAVCLGCLCVPDKQAKIKLMGSLDSKDINVTARVSSHSRPPQSPV